MSTATHVTMYVTPNCPGCDFTTRSFDARGVTYRTVDITQHASARDYVVEELGYRQGPVVVVEDGTGNDHWSGARPDHIERIAQLVATGAI